MGLDVAVYDLSQGPMDGIVPVTVQEQKCWREGGPFHNHSRLTKGELPVPTTLGSAGSEVFVSR